jgi:uncharacterized protein
MHDYAPGTPSWMELSSPDTDASAAFYRALMGWEATEPGPVDETGGYRMFEQGGKTVGGSVVVDPMDVMDIGRMAFFADPAGAAFGVWQPKSFKGADLVNEPNSFCWTELATRDIESGRAFYPAVFGWDAGKPQFEGAPETYTVWEIDGKPVGGMMEMSDEYYPPEVPPHWAVCFAVADCDAIAARGRQLGATITFEPVDMSIGRFAGLMDPQGAAFAVMQMPASG